MGRVRDPGRVRRVTTVSRTEIGVRSRHDDGAVFFAHRRDRVRVVRIGQMLLENVKNHVSDQIVLIRV